MKKVVLKLEFHDEKIKQKAMQKVSALSGVESIAVDAKDKKLTVIGDIDPVKLTAKLRKLCHTDMVSVGPAKEPDKKKDESNKKDDQSKNGGGGGGGGDGKKGDNKKNDSKGGDAVNAYPALPPLPAAYHQQLQHYQTAYQQHYPPPTPYQYHPYTQPSPAYFSRSAEEDPNSCVIC